jgi:hypothetical protein
MRIRAILGILPLLIVPVATAGLIIDSLESTHPNGTLYRFPLIGGESPAAFRINTFLQTRELEKLPGHYRESPFEDVWPEEDSYNGVTEIDYVLAFVQPGILTVEIVGEFYGAYPSAIGNTYHFDARTGEVITLRDLITPEGLAQLDKEITAKRLQWVDAFLAGEKVAGAELRTDPEEAEEQKELYRECRDGIEMAHPVFEDEFRLTQYDFLLAREPCAPRVIRALDELDLSIRRGYEPLKELLSDYGSCLLIERRASCPRSYGEIAPGVYRGKIAERYPITIVIDTVDQEGLPRARYYYDKHGKAIQLRASRAEDGSLVLAESGPPPARFELRIQPDGRLQGRWTQEDKDPLKVDLR